MKFSIFVPILLHQGVEEQQAVSPSGPAPLPPTPAARPAAQRDRRLAERRRVGVIRVGRTGAVAGRPLGAQQHLQDRLWGLQGTRQLANLVRT